MKRLASEPVLAYLAGFFDGDGCVACASGLSGCYLSTAQSFDQAEVLMLFYETFGGSIVLHIPPAWDCANLLFGGRAMWPVRPKCSSALGTT